MKMGGRGRSIGRGGGSDGRLATSWVNTLMSSDAIVPDHRGASQSSQ